MDDCVWLHPATVMQAMLEGVNHNNYYKNVYTLTLCSTAPLHHNAVRQALTHLFRKVATLRLCFRRREGRLWACQMTHENMDFQVLEGVEADQVTEDLGFYEYNVTEGPLWCARLLTKEENLKTPRVEIEATFPYTCTLAIANHHSIADGTTNTQTVDFFLQIINDVIAGKDINDSKQMGVYKDAHELQELLDIQDKELEKDPEHLNALLHKIKDGDPIEPLLASALPPIQGIPYKTKFIETVLNSDNSKRFIQKCKDNGITVNSGFVALLNVSLVDFMRETGLVCEDYPIKAAHTVNLRRYLPKDMANILGVHTSLLINTIMTPACWQDSFWDYAKKVHKQLYKGLESEPITFHCLIRKVFYNNDSFKTAYSIPHPSEWDQVIAPIGNLDVRIPTEGDHVRLGHLVRFSTNAFDPIMPMYHTFRGRLCYSLSYSVNLMSKETAQHLVDLLVKNLISQL